MIIAGALSQGYRARGPSSRAAVLIAAEAQGIAIDGIDLSMIVRDTGTPANNFNGDVNSKLTYTSPSTKWIRNSAGLFVSGTTLRTEYDASNVAIGIRMEAQATNLALHCDDFTNAVWTKTNLTAAKTATGPDGVTNSASTLTATAGNATALQAITSASASRATSTFIKRRTGSGVVELTQNNGTTWTAVTVTANWTRVSVPAATLTDPTVGIRIVTSGDEVDVAFFGHETGGNISSPIRTGAATVTRAADNITQALASFSWGNTNPMSAFVDFTRCDNNATAQIWQIGAVVPNGETRGLYFPANTAANVFEYDGFVATANLSVPITAGANVRHKVASRHKLNDVRSGVNGTLSALDNSATMCTPTSGLQLASGDFGGTKGNLWLRQFLLVPREMLDAELLSRST